MTTETTKTEIRAEHTPEPWLLDSNGYEEHSVYVAGEAIAAVRNRTPRAVGNATRIIVCVNACAGVPDGDLRLGVVAELRAALTACIETMESAVNVLEDDESTPEERDANARESVTTAGHARAALVERPIGADALNGVPERDVAAARLAAYPALRAALLRMLRAYRTSPSKGVWPNEVENEAHDALAAAPE